MQQTKFPNEGSLHRCNSDGQILLTNALEAENF